MKPAKSCEWVEGCRNKAVAEFPVETVNGRRTWLFLCSGHAAVYAECVAEVTRPLEAIPA